MSELRSEEMIEVTKMNGLSRLIGIIVSPTKTFEAIRQKPAIWIPMLVLLLVPAAYYFFMWDYLAPAMIITLEEQAAMYGTEVTPDMMDLQMNIAKYSTYATGIGFIIVNLISAVYYLIANSIANGDAKYKHLLSMSLYISMIGLLSLLVSAITTILGMDPTTPLTSVASFLPASMYGTVIYALLSTVEVFSIWSIIITVMGLRIVANMSKKASIITVAISYVFTTGLVVGSAVLTQVMSNLM